jgi:hypothetical protein
MLSGVQTGKRGKSFVRGKEYIDEELFIDDPIQHSIDQREADGSILSVIRKGCHLQE